MSVKLDTENRNRKAERAEFTVLFEDDKTCITSWCFPPGSETGWHHHTYDYVTIQQSGGKLELENDRGDKFIVDYKENQTAAYKAPVKHNATNISDEEVRVTEIEYKS